MSHPHSGIAAWNFKLKAEIHSYEDCVAFLGESAPPRVGRVLGPHMQVTGPPMNNGYYAVVLYDTEIIRYYPDGSFSVDNGGLNTLTTSARLSAVLPEGWNAFHHQKQLGIGTFGRARLWPLDHSKRIENGAIR
jgi:hypothetical protein